MSAHYQHFAQVEAVLWIICASKLAQVAYQLVRSAGGSRSLAPRCCGAALFICLLCLAGAVEELMGKLCTRAY